MTGFGRSSFEVEGVGLAVEVRAVNHRHVDVSVRLPRLLSRAEPLVKERVKGHFDRGRMDVSVSFASGSSTATSLELDREVASRYVAFAEELRREHDLPGELHVAALLALPGVARVVERELPEDALTAALASAVDEAVATCNAMRLAEGEVLERELTRRLDGVTALVAELEERADGMLETAKERLRRRAEQLHRESGLLDEARLHQEIVIAADRLDVREELVRLRSHVKQFADVLAGAGAGSPVGRRLEFLLQEMGREANTLGSKGADASVAHRVVDLKTEIERIREQVQNVE
jgi:uncharacterized protein (TIGR00255 family)